MSILGISAGFHDAAATVIDHRGDILFAGHSERYSKIKNDKDIHYGLMEDVLLHCSEQHTEVAYYERPWLKQMRRVYSGEGFDLCNLTARQVIKNQLGGHFKNSKIHTFNHHLSHAAAGFQTSPFDRATVVVIDAIGEFDTVTIWGAEYVNGRAKYRKLWGQKYPHSIGLFYSAMTEAAGLKPNEDEYILMGMSAYGRKGFAPTLQNDLIHNEWDITFKQNLHAGYVNEHNLQDADLAASSQELAEQLILNTMARAKKFGWSNNLVYMGGVALNCAANARIGNYFDDIWIMPNPGDAGSSLGAAALAYGSRINWTTAFLGHTIPGAYPVTDTLDALLRDRIVGVASGRAEFGPRALGNRSLLADPRGHDIKDKVNEIKRRQQFRPFAPVILEELADTYFDMPRGWGDSRYMQTVARCRVPELFPAIVHWDGTSRVQTVPKDGSGIRELLEKWFILTDCPMLLNTSLNIKGEPVVNDRADADRFEQRYNVKVVS
jgi:carbamoyltransferase